MIFQVLLFKVLSTKSTITLSCCPDSAINTVVVLLAPNVEAVIVQVPGSDTEKI